MSKLIGIFAVISIFSIFNFINIATTKAANPVIFGPVVLTSKSSTNIADLEVDLEVEDSRGKRQITVSGQKQREPGGPLEGAIYSNIVTQLAPQEIESDPTGGITKITILAVRRMVVDPRAGTVTEDKTGTIKYEAGTSNQWGLAAGQSTGEVRLLWVQEPGKPKLSLDAGPNNIVSLGTDVPIKALLPNPKANKYSIEVRRAASSGGFESGLDGFKFDCNPLNNTCSQAVTLSNAPRPESANPLFPNQASGDYTDFTFTILGARMTANTKYVVSITSPDITSTDGLNDRVKEFTVAPLISPLSCSNPVLKITFDPPTIPADQTAGGQVEIKIGSAAAEKHIIYITPYGSLNSVKTEVTCSALNGDCSFKYGLKNYMATGGYQIAVKGDTTGRCGTANLEITPSTTGGSSTSAGASPNVNPTPYTGPVLSSYLSACKENGLSTAIGCIHTDLTSFILDLFKFLTGAAGGIAFILMIMGAFNMITSQGNPQALNSAKDRFTSALIGLLFIIFATLLLQIIGLDILGLPGFGRS